MIIVNNLYVVIEIANSINMLKYLLQYCENMISVELLTKRIAWGGCALLI